MPEKEGAEEKTTKSVVNKKQKQMMGEEGYDIARDMGRVRPSKDKKDATTMPPSKEMEKTRKVNKGPSALELVKKKYKGQIMNVKKEELDLTQVAEAFGGYIIEAEVTGSGSEKKKKGQAKVTFGKGDSIKTTQRSAGTEGRMDSRNPKMGGGASTFDLEPEPGDKRKLDNTTFGGPVKIIKKGTKKPKVTVVQTNVKDPKASEAAKDFKKKLGSEKIVSATMQDKLEKTIKSGKKPPKPRVFSYMRKISPEAQKRVDAVKKQIEIKNIIKPDRRLKSSRVATSSPEFGKPKIPSTKKSSVKLTKPSDVELPKSFKDFSSKLKSLKSDIKQTKAKVKQLPKPNPKVTSNYTSDPDLSRMSDADQKKYKKIKDTTPKGGIPNWMKDFDKKRKEIQQQPYQKGVKPAFKRVVLTKGKGLRGLASKIVRNPVGTAIAAGVARDSFRMPPLPQLPKVAGGKVGRRTAG